MNLKNGFGKCSSLLYQPMHVKIKTWTLHFPAKENPNMEKALFDWPIVLQYDVKAKYRLISRKCLGMTFFYPSVRLTNQKPRAFVSVPWTNQIAVFPFVCCFCFVQAFSFQAHTKIALSSPMFCWCIFRSDRMGSFTKFNFLSKDQLTKKKDRILIKDLISNKWKYRTKKQGWFYSREYIIL